MAGSERELRVLRLAARQLGVVSRAQVLASGMTARQVDRRRETGRWASLLPGVYRVEGAAFSWHQLVRATCLWAGDDAVLSHRTAAALWGLSRFAEDGSVHVSHPGFLPAPRDVVTHDLSLRRDEVVTLRGLRVTTLPRTLLDLAATEPEDDVRAAVDSALSRRRLTLDALRAVVDRHRGHRGVKLLARLLHAYEGGDGPTESELEARVLELLEEAGLPRAVKQRSLHASGRLRRIDFHFPGTNVVIEADGYAWHSDLRAFEKDRERANALAARGLVVLRWTWRALLDRPFALIDELEKTLERGRRAA